MDSFQNKFPTSILSFLYGIPPPASQPFLGGLVYRPPPHPPPPPGEGSENQPAAWEPRILR